LTTTFDALGVAPDLVAALAERGITEAFPIQALTIADALAGRDVCGKAKTGSGKTLAFGLPVLQTVKTAEPRRPRALILVPTRELATQVREELDPIGKARDIRVGAVYGGADIDKQINKLKAGVEVIAATPGRMIDLIERKEIQLTDVGIVVLDEADRMADMGFMPQVEWILRHIPGDHQTLLFSATLDGVVQGLIDRYQTDPVRHEVASQGVTVANMVHRFLRPRSPRPSLAAAPARSCSAAPSGARTASSSSSRPRASTRAPSTATCARACGSGRSPTSRRASSRCWWPPTWPPGASTSTRSTS
jgi:superfamily II DNA/RNA helicase